ncbi:hypothetical protein FKM82_012873 [Ascaphus truei]
MHKCQAHIRWEPSAKSAFGHCCSYLLHQCHKPPFIHTIFFAGTAPFLHFSWVQTLFYHPQKDNLFLSGSRAPGNSVYLQEKPLYN